MLKIVHIFGAFSLEIFKRRVSDLTGEALRHPTGYCSDNIMEFQLSLKSTPFDLEDTLDCGQVFGWRREGGWWIGVVDGRVLKVKRDGDTLKVKSSSDDGDEGFIRRYFRLDDPLVEILVDIGKDDIMAPVASKLKGLRLIRQEPWECTASFVCATYKNIQAIEQMISNLCRLLGGKVEFEGAIYYSYPKPEVVAASEVGLLKRCGLGYRAGFLQEAAKRIVSGSLVFQDLLSVSYEAAWKRLTARTPGGKLLPGVGPKVADCILLFSLNKLEAFPIDIWIRRAVLKFYSHLFDTASIKHMASSLQEGASIGLREYEEISRTMRTYFGEYAGYAQEYLYHYMRSLGGLPPSGRLSLRL